MDADLINDSIMLLVSETVNNEASFVLQLRDYGEGGGVTGSDATSAGGNTSNSMSTAPFTAANAAGESSTSPTYPPIPPSPSSPSEYTEEIVGNFLLK